MAESLFKILALLLTVTSISHAVVQYSKFKNPTLTKSKLKGANLYPQSSETRQIISLDGIWDFRKSSSNPEQGFQEGWYYRDLHKSGPVIQMPVPSSYNDVGENAELRDHVGVVWYDRRFFVPSHWQKGRVWLRFGSVHYAAQLFINGKPEGYHEIGHLPFEVEITKSVDFNKSNLLTVAVDNTLHADTIPQGLVKDTIVSYGHGESDQPFPFLPPQSNNRNDVVTQQQFYTFDFFNYAGIHRSVQLYYTPRTYIDDVIINTDKQGLTGFVIYNVTYKGPSSDVKCLIQLFNKLDEQIAAAQECAGLLIVSNAQFWWPYLMNPEPGYLYTLQVSLQDKKGALIDTYSQKVGIRTVTWSNSSIFVNDIPIYFRGFGMHEDSDLRGKGWDPVLWVKNFNLIKWVGANAFRTSHYPYAEEIYQMADSHGIMIIDECPSVDTDGFSNELLQKHMQSLTDLIRRDKNHASVVMWSISNEPRTANRLSGPYFNEVVKHVKSMDLSRPVTIAISQQYNTDNAAQYLDIISFNRYNAWYSETGRLSIVTRKVVDEAKHWHKTFKKPVLMSEYGADTMAGLHLEPNYVWSEEFQVALMSEHFKAFDELRQMKFFVGEFIWNFADFNTAQTYTRVGGNRKGIFTRQRQPKASAHHLQTRYLTLAATDAGGPAPGPANYISDFLPLPREEL